MTNTIPCKGCRRGAPYHGPYDAAKSCRWCYLYDTDTGYRVLWGGRPEEVAVVPCRHFGTEVGREACLPCQKKTHLPIHLKVFACAIHGRCTPQTPLPDTPCCRGCHDGPTVVWANADGVGDALMGLCAVAGYQGAFPHREVVYRVLQPHQEDWVKLFHGYDRLTRDAVSTVTGRELKLHFTQEETTDTRLIIPRWQHYANSIGSPASVVPAPRAFAGEVLARAQPYAGAAVLSPYSCWPSRAWPVPRWLELEKALAAQGLRCVILDHFQAAAKKDGFASPVLGYDPPLTAAVLKGAAIFVGNDSGMAHAAGMLRTPGVALTWFWPGQRIFDFYGSIRSVHSDRGPEGITVTTALEAALSQLQLGKGVP